MLKKNETTTNNTTKPSQTTKPTQASTKKTKYKDSINVDRLTQMRDYKELVKLLGPDSSSAKRLIRTLDYEDQLTLLQIEMIRLQRWVAESKQRVAVLFEGRDAAGKGGAIRRFTEHLNPRAIRVVALPKPNEVERGQWYFQRYINQLPNPGEIVFFDRSWYNRAVVEPVMGFCTKKEYERFMQQVPEFEHMLYEDGITVIKFWFSISKDEQLERFTSRAQNPLKQWKISPVDQRAQELWDHYSHYKEEMFAKTHNSFSPWIIVKANSKKRARLESIRKVLSTVPYTKDQNTKVRINPDPNIVHRYHRKIKAID
jgi:polyphosphate kinase